MVGERGVEWGGVRGGVEWEREVRVCVCVRVHLDRAR